MVGIRQRECWHEELLLGLYVQYYPAGHDHFELWAGGKEVCHLHCRADHLLEIVQEQQHLLALQFVLQTLQERLTTHLTDAKALRDSCNDQRRIAYGSQINERDAIGELVAEFCRHLQGQARLPCAAGACQRHQMHILTAQELCDGRHFLLPSNEGCWLNGQIVGMGTQGLERWEIAGQASDDELVEVARAL